MSYADLSAISKQKVDTMLRDIVEFEGFGINEDEVNQFFEEIRSLDQFRTDDDLRGCVSQAVIERNDLKASVQHEIRVFVSSLLRIYKQNNPIFTRMRVGGLTKLTDTQLFRTGESLHSTLVSVLPSLEVYGVTQATIDSFYTMLQSFSEKITDVNNAVNERNKFTHQRISKANDIYDKLLIYTRIGKTIWEESNEALYNDYVIERSNYSPEPTISEDEGDSGGEGEFPNG